MSKSIKLKNDTYIDSSGIVHNKEILKEILNNKVIYDFGENEYGNWTKYSNGEMICRRTIEKTLTCNFSWGSLFVGLDTTQYNFAQEFIEPPEIQLTAINTTSSSFWLSNYTAPVITKTYYKNYAIMRPTTSGAVAVKLFIQAIGKWK